MPKLKNPKTPKRLPPKLPIFVVKAVWASTATRLLVEAATSEAAWEKAWKKLAKTEGGDSCLRVIVEGRVV